MLTDVPLSSRLYFTSRRFEVPCSFGCPYTPSSSRDRQRSLDGRLAVFQQRDFAGHAPAPASHQHECSKCYTCCMLLPICSRPPLIYFAENSTIFPSSTCIRNASQIVPIRPGPPERNCELVRSSDDYMDVDRTAYSRPDISQCILKN